MSRFLFFVLSLSTLLMGAVVPASAQLGDPSCTDFDAWEWAQSVFESDPQAYDALDPDTDGVACPDLPRGGFAPAFWTDQIPEDVEEAEIVKLVDGDTLDVILGGVTNRVRILRADTPETQNEQHCGGQEATNFAEYALSFNDEGSRVYLERDTTKVDRYGRELAYVWFEIDGQPYMLNHILINNGWAEDVDYGDRLYDDQFKEATAFAQRHDLGVWGLCGEFGLPIPKPTEVPAVPTEAPYEPPTNDPGTGCDPNYSPCVPDVSYDLDCGDIGFSVTVIGSDPHGFDRDGDGYGCESY
jgi:endonuclease YncB( thermonuclease family)